MEYYWLIIIVLFGGKMLFGKRASSYNGKWMVAYLLYVLWMHAEWFIYLKELGEGMDEEYIWLIILGPLILYLIFPTMWKILARWKLFKRIEEQVDK